jgi:hypothetical protein
MLLYYIGVNKTHAERGVLYVKWGPLHGQFLQRSIESLRAVHPELPYHVHELPPDSTLLDKAAMCDFTPFEQTLYLDTDTVVLDRLEFGFDRAARHSLACCICECPWARRYGGICGETVAYNTGVLFFTRQARPVFDAWKSLARTIDSSIHFKLGGQVRIMPVNDQAGFAKAIDDLGYVPFILPTNWNLRPRWHKSFFGPVKIWHDYDPPPPELMRWNQNQNASEKIIEYIRMP